MMMANGTTDHAYDCWAFFDKVYCISVEERTDRRRQVRSQFARVGLSARVEFVTVRMHPHDPEQGIFESHMECLKRGLKADAESILVFEDDVVFDRFSPARLKAGIDFVSATGSWKALFLGCLVSASKKTAAPSVLKIKYRSLAHAYALHRVFAASLVETPWQQVPFDTVLRRFTRDGFFTLYPSFVFQSDSPTDNRRLAGADRWRRRLGGLKRIQKLNEFYHCNRLAVIGLHLLLILFALAWIWL